MTAFGPECSRDDGIGWYFQKSFGEVSLLCIKSCSHRCAAAPPGWQGYGRAAE